MFTTLICSDTNEKVYTYAEYLNTRHWKLFRESYIKRFEGVCEICTIKGDELHHLHYDNLGHEQFDDVIFLCRGCHQKEHMHD